MDFTDGKVLKIDIEDEMRKSYMLYSMSTIVSRALPDVRDGLKPIHRKILYAMHAMNLGPGSAYRKSATVIGEVIGKYHPHGDVATYDAMVRMAQDFSMRYPLVDGHGNFGSVDGDPAAAYRYTEARMTSLAAHMLRDIEKDTVDFQPNYDGREKEPVVLPSRFPNLLVNGVSGIAVGMATNIPPHNLGEVIDGICYVIDNPNCSVKDIMRRIKGPDFPTGGIILGRSGITRAYESGRGAIKVRAKCHIETTKSGKTTIIVSELPYMVNKARLIEKIADLHKERKVEGISNLNDESDRSGMRIVIELKRDANPNVVLNQLYKHTQLEDTFGINLLVLVDNQPRVLGIKDIIGYYIDHQKQVIVRRTKFDLRKAEERAHILEGLRIALDNIDEIVELLRKSKSPAEGQEKLMSRFGLSELQAHHILIMQLQRLTGLEREKIEAEYKEVQALIAELRAILADETKVLAIIKDELQQIKTRFGDPRRTVIGNSEEAIDVEDLIAKEDIVVTLTHSGYIKRLSLSTYRSQRRGGKGIMGMNTRDGDFVEHIFITSTHDQLLCFSNKGKVYSLKGFDIPEASRQARGTNVINLIPVDKDERINTVIPVKDFSDDEYLFFATEKGIVKKTSLFEYSNIRSNGLIAISLDEDDRVVGVKLTSPDDHVLLITKKGQAARFREDDVRPMGRNTRGVIGIRLDEDDCVVAMDAVMSSDEPHAYVLVVTENGYGKRTPFQEYPVHNRGVKGVKTLQLTEKNGPIVGAKIVTHDNDLMLISAEGVIIRTKSDGISVMGRSTQGVRVMALSEGDKAVAIAKASSREDESDESGDGKSGPSSPTLLDEGNEESDELEPGELDDDDEPADVDEDEDEEDS